MKRINLHFKTQIILMLLVDLTVIWVTAAYQLHGSHQTVMHEAEVGNIKDVQIFAEYTRSTIKRVNEFLLDARTRWTGDWQAFAALVRTSQENIDDVTFQVAIIDRDGMLAFSNLSRPNDRIDLGQREHFRVHKEAGGADRLFISRPVFGKVSKKWSIQLTRPIFRNGEFDGVIVVSVSPEQFASFAGKLRKSEGSVMTLVRDTGEILARHPQPDNSIGVVLRDRPFLDPDAPLMGTFRLASAVDRQERVWGYVRMPEYGLVIVAGDTLSAMLEPYLAHRAFVLAAAGGVSLLSVVLFYLLYRSLNSFETVKRQLDEIFNLSPDGLVSFDRAGLVKYANPAFLRMTGMSLGKIMGLPQIEFEARLRELAEAPERWPGLDPCFIASKVSLGETPSGNKQRFLTLRGPGGMVLELLGVNSDAPSVSRLLYVRDVTHEVEVDRMKSEFLSHAAHELRTPMASIFGFTELLISQDFDEATRKDLLQTIHKQTAWLVDIINELLDIARIEARRGKDFNIEAVPLPPLVDAVVAALQIDGQRWPVRIDCPGHLPAARADAAKLRQALTNILGNAVKYSPEGGAIDIRCAARGDGGRAMIAITVTDHGIGMTPDQVARVCERFYRADTSGNIPGTGLGMAIVKEIAELLGGSVSIQSAPSQGTSVRLDLPVDTAGGVVMASPAPRLRAAPA